MNISIISCFIINSFLQLINQSACQRGKWLV